MPQKPTELDPTANTLAFFGAELRHYRNRAGMSQGLLGEKVYCSGSLVGLVEKAQRMPPMDFAERCDEVLDTGGALTRLWPLVSKASYPSWFQPFVELEQTATEIRTFEVQTVPGLLQTEGYARAVLRAGRPRDTDEQIDRRVTARLERQRLLHRNPPPMLWVVLDEGVLRRTIGGSKVMHDQLTHLVEAARSPGVVVQVLPYSVGEHAALDGAMVLLSFDGTPNLAYVEGPGSGRLIERPSEVAECSVSYDLLRASALSPDASIDVITTAMREI